ncbi:extracellular solute-binding protein [Clostridium sartagoforme]|uniref:Extracellular solute-binding protein n=1 Tax=Clostridium sartagoforme TaxID=84031 RepID=A0A4S2DNA1_9CLOT|nr:extracellular solute-binding protein [Clostridium sartagoforme]TGY43565.1 extracellular solute-binding protein [Clostridium sartagoforme]
MKRLVSFILLISILLTGCSISSKESETDSDGITEITFWHSMDGVFGDIVKEQIDEFNNTIGKEKGIKVTGVFQSWPGTTSLMTAMSADDIKNMPDVIQLYGENVDMIRDYERTVWAEDFINNESSTIKKEDLIANTVTAQSIDGKMIGVPYTASSLMLYYNMDYLKEAGFSEPPKTIAEMADMMIKISEKTEAENGLNVAINQYELESFISIQGENGTYFGNNESGHNKHMTEFSEEGKEALKNFLSEWEKVIETGVYKPVTDSINEEFSKGLHAMTIMTSSRIPTIEKLVGDSFEWGVTSIPTVNEGDVVGAYPSGSGLYIMDRESEAKKKAAWEFVSYMASKEAQVKWVGRTGYTPVNIHVQELDEYKKAVEVEPRLQNAMNNLRNTPNTVVPSFTPNSNAIGTIIKDAMRAFGSGLTTKEEAYDKIVDGIAKSIEVYYRANPVGRND